jgi:hypothetical protein
MSQLIFLSYLAFLSNLKWWAKKKKIILYFDLLIYLLQIMIKILVSILKPLIKGIRLDALNPKYT